MNLYRTMKYASFAATVAFAAFIFAGCKNSTSPTGTTTTPGTMQAQVNGSAWPSLYVPGVSGIARANMSNGVLEILGISAIDNSTIALDVVNPKIGTDSLGATGDEGFYSKVLGASDTTIYASIPNSVFSLYTGSISITQYDTTAKTVSGTFHFVARLQNKPSDTVTVTNGSFYQVGWQ